MFNLSTNEKIGNYEGVIEVGSNVTGYDESIPGMGQYGLVYWMTGAYLLAAQSISPIPTRSMTAS